MRAETLFLKITPITPVHIGTGEVYEPASFYIDERVGELVHFDQGIFINMLSQKDLAELSRICKKGTPASIIELMRFVDRRAKGMLLDGDRVPVSSAFTEHYNKTINMNLRDNRKVKNELAKFEIWRTSFDPHTWELYMPGSAIKGAIRTAVLNFKGHGVTERFKGSNASKRLQQKILQFSWNNTSTDPFRLIRVSDFISIPQMSKRFIYYAINRKKGNRRSARSLHPIFETIDVGTEFFGKISIEAQNPCVKSPLNAKTVINALEYFYGGENKRENKELDALGIKGVHLGQGIPIRIGRHSGAECVTVEGHRHIMIKGPGKLKYYKDHATTLWLASPTRIPKVNDALRPFGWCVIETISEAEWKDALGRWLDYRDNLAQLKYENACDQAQDSLVHGRIRREVQETTAVECATEISPEEARKKRLQEFERSLPASSKFPGEASKIIDNIETIDDPVLKQQAIQLVNSRFKNQIKKGRKKGKKWALYLTDSEG